VAAYLRVSSAGQDSGSQRDALERAAAARGETIAEWYSEKQSGAKLARPELARLRADARLGRVRRLYVFRLDRLTRTGIRDTLSLLDELRHHGCRVMTIADGWDLEGPAADVVCAVLAWVAQMERAALRERITAARARVEAEGKRWGRPRRLVVLEVERLRAAAPGASVRELARRLKIPKSTVARVLSQKGAYSGGQKSRGAAKR
jgi:DNA invertase Pin-like site-specific DNA recombinase